GGISPGCCVCAELGAHYTFVTTCIPVPPLARRSTCSIMAGLAVHIELDEAGPIGVYDAVLGLDDLTPVLGSEAVGARGGQQLPPRTGRPSRSAAAPRP